MPRSELGTVAKTPGLQPLSLEFQAPGLLARCVWLTLEREALRCPGVLAVLVVQVVMAVASGLLPGASGKA